MLSIWMKSRITKQEQIKKSAKETFSFFLTLEVAISAF